MGLSLHQDFVLIKVQEDTKEAEQQGSSEARAYFGGKIKDASATNAHIEVEATPQTEKL